MFCVPILQVSVRLSVHITTKSRFTNPWVLRSTSQVQNFGVDSVVFTSVLHPAITSGRARFKCDL